MSKKVPVAAKEQEAKNLCDLFIEHKVSNVAAFAREFKVPGGKAMVKQHQDGSRPISMDAAKAYMHGFGCRLERISQRLADEAESSALLVLPSKKNQPAQAQSVLTTERFPKPVSAPEILSPLMVAATRLDRSSLVPSETKAAITRMLQSLLK